MRQLPLNRSLSNSMGLRSKRRIGQQSAVRPAAAASICYTGAAMPDHVTPCKQPCVVGMLIAHAVVGNLHFANAQLDTKRAPTCQC